MSVGSITKNSWVGLKISTLGVSAALVAGGTWKTNEYFNHWQDVDRAAHAEIVSFMQANQSAIEQNQLVLHKLVSESISHADHADWGRLFEALNTKSGLIVPEID